SGRTARSGDSQRLHPRRRRCPGAMDRRRADGRPDALRRSAQASRGHRDQPAAASGGRFVTFSWPMVLWTLAVVPLLIAGYIVIVRHKRAAAKRYAGWAPSARAGLLQHLPAVLFLIAIIALIGAMARPNAVVVLPSRHDTVMLAMDVSGSMK